MRNLTKNETVECLGHFGKKLRTMQINGKPLITGADEKTIVVNSEISMQEIQQTYGIKENTLVDFIRQLYIRTISSIIKEAVKDDIANLPTVSFSSNGHTINLNY